MLAPATAFCRRYLLPVLLLGNLGACQRAGYQFQVVENAACPIIAPASAAESAVVTIALPPATLYTTSAGRPAKAHRPWHPTARPRRLSRAMPAPLSRRAVATASVAARVPRPRQEPALGPVHYRSHAIAIILAALAITYLPLSLHNFYLGYYGRGVLAIMLLALGLYLTLLGALGLFFGGGALAVSYVGVGVLAGWFCWQLSDLIRIISRNLKPKDGEYKSRSPKA